MITHMKRTTLIAKLNLSQVNVKSKSRFRDYSDAHVLVKGTITAENTITKDADPYKTNKKVILKIVPHLLLA